MEGSNEWPQPGNTYYWVSTNNGVICESVWRDYDEYCQFRKSVGDIFRTKLEARTAIKDWQARAADRAEALR